MYKKFALLLPLVALLLGACHNDNDTPGPTICPTDNVWSYTGQLDVTPLEGSPFTAFAESDIVFTLAPADEKTYTLMIPKGTYTIRNLRGSSPDGATLSVSFDCYTMHVDYRGNR